MNLKFLYSLLVILFVLVLSACNNNVVYSEYKNIDVDKGWAVKDKITLEADIEDTESRHDVYINVRNADSYQFRNLFVFLHTTYPDGKMSTDTLECILSDERGNWLGKGAGDLWDNTIPFKKNTQFKQKGKYKFTFEQAMRYGSAAVIDPLPMILDIGITIEKSKTN
jgi:gliding motility-associated lipoprotein GldH